MIALLPIDLDGSGCYRMLFPGRELTANGVPAAMPPARTHRNRDGSYLIEFGLREPEVMATRVSTFVVQRSIQELYAKDYLPALRKLGVRTAYETDDLMTGLPKWHPARGLETATFHVTEAYAASLAMERAAMEQSDVVTVSTEHLAEVHGWHPDVRVLRNRLDRTMWDDVPMQYEVERPRGRLRIGYMGNAAFHRGDLELLRGVVGPWLERHPEVDFVAAGDGRTHDLLGVPPKQRITTTGVPFHSMRLADIVAVMDVGLVPLDGVAFNESKSCLKGMEYAAAGIPCIASPTAEYRWWWKQAGNGCLLASKPAEWREALNTMLDDELRRRCGRLARATAERHWIQNHWQEWRNAWTSP